MGQSLRKQLAVRRIEVVLKKHEETYAKWLRANFPEQAEAVINAQFNRNSRLPSTRPKTSKQ